MGNQARGYLSKVTVDFEDVFGADPAAPSGVILPINTFDLKEARALNTAATITGSRNPVMPFEGNTSVTGNAVVPVDAVSFGYWLKMMFGDPVTTGAGPTYTHVFKIGENQPSMVMEKAFATAAASYMKSNGCKISKMSIKLGGDGELTASFDIEGAKETLGTTAYDADAPVSQLIRFGNFQAVMKENGTIISYLTGFSFDLNFGLDTTQYCIGGGGARGDIPEGIAAATGTLSGLFKDTTLLDKAMASAETKLEVILTNGTNVLSFAFNEVRLQVQTPGISGPQGVQFELPWTAYYDNDAADSVVVATLTCPKASY